MNGSRREPVVTTIVVSFFVCVYRQLHHHSHLGREFSTKRWRLNRQLSTLLQWRKVASSRPFKQEKPYRSTSGNEFKRTSIHHPHSSSTLSLQGFRFRLHTQIDSSITEKNIKKYICDRWVNKRNKFRERETICIDSLPATAVVAPARKGGRNK